MLIAVVVLIVLIIVNAFFAASEIALISLNDNKIKAMAEDGHKKAKLLANLLSEPSRFLATIQIGITLAGFLASAFAAESFSGDLASLLADLGVPLSENVLATLSLIIITLVLSYFTLVLGELVPKRLAMTKAEPIAMFAARPLSLLLTVSLPFVKLLTKSTNGLVRLFGVDPNANDENVTEEEIRMMVDVGRERGTIQEDEKQMIDNIFDLDNKVVSDIMTHRTRIVGISIDASLLEVVRLVNLEKYTRFPVYEDDIDNIVGVLHAKDLIQYMGDGCDAEFDLRRLIRKPMMVSESKRVDDLYKEMQKKKIHLVVVIDEYGGTAGIVTLEDMLEEIVGNIFDEHDEDDREFVKLDELTYSIVGTASLDDVEKLFDVKLPIDEYDTLSGFLIGQLGRIPGQEETPTIEFNGLVFKVQETGAKRIQKVKVCRAE